MQHQLSSGLLLNEKGHLNESGYHHELVKTYHRKQIKGLKFRIKEWDYYYVGNQQYGIALTVADNSYLWLSSVTIFDFIDKEEITSTQMGPFSFGNLKLPSSSKTGNIHFKRKKHDISILVEDQERTIKIFCKKFKNGNDLIAEIHLTETSKNSMVIATPFEKPTHFYYNQKINLLEAKGYFKYGENFYDLSSGFGVLDWGRGVWTYKNTWYWSSLSGIENEMRIGFNLGYGFGDTSKATENMLFVDDQVFKLNDVVFEIPQKDGKDDYLSIWHIYSQSKDINLTFTPILDRSSYAKVLFLKSNQHQVFGKFAGTFKISNEKTIEINGLIGFAEKVTNHW
jgi:hypothetical protein